MIDNTIILSKRIESLTREEEIYKVRYEITKLVHNHYSLPVHTGNLKPNGQIATSRNIKGVQTAVKTVTDIEVQEVPEELAKAIFQKVAFNQPQHLGPKRWTATAHDEHDYDSTIQDFISSTRGM